MDYANVEKTKQVCGMMVKLFPEVLKNDLNFSLLKEVECCEATAKENCFQTVVASCIVLISGSLQVPSSLESNVSISFKISGTTPSDFQER